MEGVITFSNGERTPKKKLGSIPIVWKRGGKKWERGVTGQENRGGGECDIVE